MLAIEPFDESHWTEPVMFCVLPSVKVPVAANCSVVPRGMAGIAGVMTIETSAAGVTVKVDEPAMPAAVAVRTVWPVDKLLANAFEPAVAMYGAHELPLSPPVTSISLP